MSEVQAEGFGASASEASSAAEGVGDVGGWDVGVQWQGPSAEEWQATQQAIGGDRVVAWCAGGAGVGV
jgi:hypothetical protein